MSRPPRIKCDRTGVRSPQNMRPFLLHESFNLKHHHPRGKDALIGGRLLFVPRSDFQRLSIT
jgi:hypothetical protein